jgi:hypothetical protein
MINARESEKKKKKPSWLAALISDEHTQREGR